MRLTEVTAPGHLSLVRPGHQAVGLGLLRPQSLAGQEGAERVAARDGSVRAQYNPFLPRWGAAPDLSLHPDTVDPENSTPLCHRLQLQRQ